MEFYRLEIVEVEYVPEQINGDYHEDKMIRKTMNKIVEIIDDYGVDIYDNYYSYEREEMENELGETGMHTICEYLFDKSMITKEILERCLDPSFFGIFVLDPYKTWEIKKAEKLEIKRMK